MSDGEEYLADNAQRDDVVVLESGLQYEVLTSGDGATPGPGDTVSTHYKGTFIDGKEFDSSYSRGEPLDIPVGGVIAGWTEALLLMKVGDKWKLHIPHDLAYGENDYGPIPGKSVLLFDMELLAVR